MIFEESSDSEEESNVGWAFPQRSQTKDPDPGPRESGENGLLQVQPAARFLSRSTPVLNVSDTDSDHSRSVSPRPTSLDVGDRPDSLSSGESTPIEIRRRSTLDAEFPLVSSLHRGSGEIAAWVHQRSRELSVEREESPQPGADRDSAIENKLLYLMVARCIAFPFSAKHQLETSPLKQKMDATCYSKVCLTLQSCLDGDKFDKIKSEIFLSYPEQKCVRNQHFLMCVEDFMDSVLQRDDVSEMCKNGKFSAKELDNIFRVLAIKHLTEMNKAPVSLQHFNQSMQDSEELQLWCNTFRKLVEQSSRTSQGHSSSPMTPLGNGSGSAAPSQDMLYKLFQGILTIKPVVHQDIYRICQVSEGREGGREGGRGREGRGGREGGGGRGEGGRECFSMDC